ncbi:hypothetical protein ACJZ2D_015118 [Fusarium nematophilum]
MCWSRVVQRNIHKLYAKVLASSPDGRTLAAGDNEGSICVFNLENLHILHRVEGLKGVATGIIFASNSLQRYDIRGATCNVWEPSVLVRKHSVDDSSSDPEEPLPSSLEAPDIFLTRPFDDDKVITVMTQAGDDNLILCHGSGDSGADQARRSRNVVGDTGGYRVM